MASRLTAALLIVALVGVGVAPCSGSESTAKARHDCCVDGQCPDQVETDRHSGGHSAPVSQAEADQCCATSEQQNQQRTAQFESPTFLLLAPARTFVIGTADSTPPDRTDPRTDPVPPPAARLHLLFSVFLV